VRLVWQPGAGFDLAIRFAKNTVHQLCSELRACGAATRLSGFQICEIGTCQLSARTAFRPWRSTGEIFMRAGMDGVSFMDQ